MSQPSSAACATCPVHNLSGLTRLGVDMTNFDYVVPWLWVNNGNDSGYDINILQKVLTEPFSWAMTQKVSCLFINLVSKCNNSTVCVEKPGKWQMRSRCMNNYIV